MSKTAMEAQAYITVARSRLADAWKKAEEAERSYQAAVEQAEAFGRRSPMGAAT